MYRSYELYARGDPGFFSFIGKALGAVAHVAEFIPGVGSVVKAVETGVNLAGSVLGGHNVALPVAGAGSLQAISLPPAPGIGSVSVGPVQVSTGGLINTNVMVGASSAGGAAGPGMKGYHLSKPRKGHPQHWVKNRHMNWANGRALGRAERRVGKFLRHASRMIRWAHPHKKGKAYPKLRRGSR